jgi:hypothetical protein
VGSIPAQDGEKAEMIRGKPQNHFRFFHFRHIFMITDAWNGSDPDEFEKAFFQTEKCHFLRFLKEGCK